MAPLRQKLRILCLHGYRQTAAAFRGKIGSFRKGLSSLAEFAFVDAPLVVPQAGGEEEEGRGWWFSGDRTFSALESSDRDDGFDLGLEAVRAAMEKDGPFDGVLAFSQVRRGGKWIRCVPRRLFYYYTSRLGIVNNPQIRSFMNDLEPWTIER